MRVLIGLGNPGQKYEKTRHNIGFRVIEHFAKEGRIELKRSLSLGALWGKRLKTGDEIRLLLPQSFMNLSGKVVLRCLSRWKFSLEEMLVVVDDLQLPLGQLRIRPNGSDGGQKGLRSIIETLGTERFPRLRVGIQPLDSLKGSWEAFVLKPFRREEASVVKETIHCAATCCRLWVEEGIEACMNQFNRKGSSRHEAL